MTFLFEKIIGDLLPLVVFFSSSFVFHLVLFTFWNGDHWIKWTDNSELPRSHFFWSGFSLFLFLWYLLKEFGSWLKNFSVRRWWWWLMVDDLIPENIADVVHIWMEVQTARKYLHTWYICHWNLLSQDYFVNPWQSNVFDWRCCITTVSPPFNLSYWFWCIHFLDVGSDSVGFTKGNFATARRQ